MNLKIKENSRTGGYCCDFDYAGEEYYASLAVVMGGYSECMIFYRGEWDELYGARDIPVTKESLKECIKDFISQMKS